MQVKIMDADDVTPKRPSKIFIMYQLLRMRLASNPALLREFDEFMRCQTVVFTAFFRMLQPYMEWLKYQYWLITFFLLVSIYYLFQPMHIIWKLTIIYFIPFYLRRMILNPARDLMAKKNVGKIVIGLIFTLMMGYMWMPIIYYTALNQQEFSLAVVGCDGIEVFYDPESNFVSDYRKMYGEYERCYDNDETTLLLATPQDIIGCQRDMDCEDFAYMVSRCLAPLHNVTCVPDLTYHADYKVPADERIGAHVGMQCSFDADGDDAHWFYVE